MTRALLVLLLVGATACSGGSGGDDPKSRYVEQAEAVCAKANADLEVAKKERPTGIDQISPYVHRIVEIARRNVEQLQALTPPPQDAPELRSKLLDPLAAQLVDAQAYDREVATAGGPELLRLVTNPPTKTRADLDFLRSYGFTECVTAADTSSATG